MVTGEESRSLRMSDLTDDGTIRGCDTSYEASENKNKKCKTGTQSLRNADHLRRMMVYALPVDLHEGVD